MQAGHIQLTDENFKAWRQANLKLHILAISSSKCDSCCETESILAQLKDLFDRKVYTAKKGKKI